MEDTALCTDKCAIISRSVQILVEMKLNQKTSANYYQVFIQMYMKLKLPGMVEPGDIMMVGDTFYVGKSSLVQTMKDLLK